jgi:hypothetical protein
MDQVSIKYTNIFHAKPSKIYPNLDFWFENKPSGNPASSAAYLDNCGCVLQVRLFCNAAKTIDFFENEKRP